MPERRAFRRIFYCRKLSRKSGVPHGPANWVGAEASAHLRFFCQACGRLERVAQICNLLYRRFVIGRRPNFPAIQGYRTASRVQLCDTADYKSALRLRQVEKSEMRARGEKIDLSLVWTVWPKNWVG